MGNRKRSTDEASEGDASYSRHRNFVFTLNNYTKEDELAAQQLECRYVVFGYERAPTTGTPHLQGFVSFKDACTLTASSKILKRASFKIANTVTEAIDYCKKDGEYFERGDPPPRILSKKELPKRNDGKGSVKRARISNMPSSPMITSADTQETSEKSDTCSSPQQCLPTWINWRTTGISVPPAPVKASQPENTFESSPIRTILKTLQNGGTTTHIKTLFLSKKSDPSTSQRSRSF